MKRFQTCIWVTVALLASLAWPTACTQSDTENTPGAGKGILRLSLNLDPTRAEGDVPANSVLRLYEIHEGQEKLIRKYEPADAVPADLYLIAGDYRVKVEAGNKEATSFAETNYYYGAVDVQIKPQEPVTKTVECTRQHIGVKVSFDASIAEKMEEFVVYVSAANSFSKEEIEVVPTLTYTEGKTGYFLLPEGVENLSWGFYGQSEALGREVQQTGTIAAPEAGHTYTLAFKYTPTADGFLSLVVVLEEEADPTDNSLFFSLQPVLKGDGFSTPLAYTAGDVEVAVVSVQPLWSLSITDETNNQTYPILTDGVAVGTRAEGISYRFDGVERGEYKATITLSADFLAPFEEGAHSLFFKVVDQQGAKTEKKLNFRRGEKITVAFDTWKNTAELKIVPSQVSATVALEYKRSTSSVWQQATVQHDGDAIYTASIAPEKIATQNEDGVDTWVLNTERGIFAGATYDYRLLLNGAEAKTGTFETQVGNQFPDGSFETTWKDGNYFACSEEGTLIFNTKRYYYDFWGSGYNDYAKALCTRDGSMTGLDGVYGAKLTASYNTTMNVNIPAPGNLFTADFHVQTSPNKGGNVSFGKRFTYNARPSAVKVKVHATIGNVDHNKHGGPIAVGQPDKGRISVCIVDWSSQHKVFAGEVAPTGAWDPNKQTSVSEGPIIGYASKFIDSTEGSTMEEITIPIYYNHDTAMPPSGNYTIVVNCSTSAYGDFMNACTTNVMYLDDFKFVY